MESLSTRYLHRKLSAGSNGFSAKNAYDDVFAGHPPKFGAQKISPARREEDYKEIFGSSRASSIPILDLPADNDMNGTADFRSSKLDYSNIFGGFRDEDGSVSYEELVANDRRIREKSSSGKFRTPSTTGSPLQNSGRLSNNNKVFSSEASYKSFDDKKQFNMSYHKTSLGSKDGTNGTTHVAQFHPVPGFSCFVEETTPQKTEADKPNPLLKNDTRREVDFCEGILEGRNAKKVMSNLTNKQTFGREVKSRSGLSWDGSYYNDKLFNAHDIDLKSHPSKVRPPSSMTVNLKNSNGHSKRSMASNTEAPKNDVSEHAAGDCSPPFFGEELDVNSAAATSAAVLKNAIQKAQESIRIAKELMERKKEGLRSCSNRSFKDRLKVADGRENIIAHEGSRTEDKNAQDTCGSVDFVSQVFSGMGRKSALRSGEVVPGFKNTERTFVSGKVIDDANAKFFGAAEKCEPATWFSTLVNIGKNRTAISSIEQAVSKFKNAQSMDKHECNVKEMNIISETSKQQEVVVHKEKAHELEYMERKPITVVTEQESEDNVDKLESDCVVHEHEEIEKSGISQDDEENEEKQTGFYRNEDCEKKLESQQKIEDEMKYEVHKLMENDFEKKLDTAQELEENENEQQEVSRQEHIEKTTKDVEKEEHELKLKRICDEEVDEERFEDAFQWVENENELKEAWGSESDEKKEKDIHMGEDTESRPEEVHELKVDEKTAKDVLDGKEGEELFEEFELEENEKGVTECYRYEDIEYIHIEADKIEVLQDAQYEDNYNKASNAWSHNVSDNISETRENCQREINDNSTEPSQNVDDNNKGMGASKDFYDFKVGEAEAAVKLGYKLKEKETSRTASLVQVVAEDGEAGNNVKVVFEVLPSEDSAPKFGSIDMYIGRTEFVQRDTDNQLDPNLDNGIEILANGSTENEDIFEENETTYDEEAGKSSLDTSNGEQQYIEVMEDLETSHRPTVSKEEEKTIQIDEEIRTRVNTEKNEENFRKTITMEEKKTKIDEEFRTSQGKEVNKENPYKVFIMEEKETRKAVPKGMEEKEYLRKIDEANKKEREREKDRIAVERAIREARERAFAGARERAERAAMERAPAEVRHRVMAEARGKLEKATAATKSLAEKASVEAKLRSERAAVERATAEARERALEKAFSQNATSRVQAERFVAEKFSVPSRDNAMKKSLSSSDLQRSDEANTESAQRSKARLERHERIMERAAKALAEKNMRDLLAQKEQAEKNRLSEALDADIKRWSSGKEGNVHALLSTLQYILGPGSGWQPISLTDIVTTSAVKKAYRKATLYVHPDKLQQRGASIQQKYICEKVFDLLKAAWNRFNSEER